MSDEKPGLGDRFADHMDDPDETDGTSDTGHTDHSNQDTTRSRSQYAMYLPDELQAELDDVFERVNAQRVIDGEAKLEKHKDFLTAVVRAGLDADWEDELDED
jgi:hypothetical protein